MYLRTTHCCAYSSVEDMLLEISPKWTLLKEVLDEISTDIQSSPEGMLIILMLAYGRIYSTSHNDLS